jgi:thioredoxin reductase (NADPH)
MDMSKFDIDIAIIGGGPSGLTAGIYAARSMRRTTLFEKGAVGGQIATTHLVENYPGFVEGATGPDLSFAMLDQAKRFDMKHVMADVTAIKHEGDHFVLEHSEGKSTAATVILATGARHRELGLPKEREFFGSNGISICATCDGWAYKDKPVVVVGGGDAAMDEGLFLTKYATKVTVVHRRDTLRASAILQERALKHEKMEFKWDSAVKEILGSERVEGVRVANLKTGEEEDLATEGLFIFIGHLPNTELVQDLVELDETGYAVVDPWTMGTETPGLFVAGDNRIHSPRQMVTAAGDGCLAAIQADRYLNES